MSERSDYPAGVPCWVEVMTPDPQGAMQFYAGVFGWDFVGPGVMPGDPPGDYYVARVRGRDVAGLGGPAAPERPSLGWVTQVAVDSVDAVVEKAAAVGGTVVVAPFDADSMGRGAVLRDPAGAVFGLWQAGVRAGAQLVNEAGSWAMSQLVTPDVSSAAGFYGGLFGWTTETFGDGPGSITMFRLPGYVGGEPEQPVSREVVATMRAGSPTDDPRWGVDFRVADIDAAATAVLDNGGQVVAAPFETPAGRVAIVTDNSGIGFTISHVG